MEGPGQLLDERDFFLGTQFLDNLTKLMPQGVKSISTDLICCWLGGLLLS